MLGVPSGININTGETIPNVVISNPYKQIFIFLRMFRKTQYLRGHIPNKWIYQ